MPLPDKPTSTRTRPAPRATTPFPVWAKASWSDSPPATPSLDDLPVRFSLAVSERIGPPYRQAVIRHQGNETWFWAHAVRAWLERPEARRGPGEATRLRVLKPSHGEASVTLKVRPLTQHREILWTYARRHQLRFEDVLREVLVHYLFPDSRR